jgi:hypothetical protein
LSTGGGLSGDGCEAFLRGALVLFLMLLEDLTSALQRSPTLFQDSPCALELFAPYFLHSSEGGTIGQICGCVLPGQSDLYCAHFEHGEA